MLRYAITDRMRLGSDAASSEPAQQTALIRQATLWASADIDFIQLREKDLAPAALASLAQRLSDSLKSVSAGRQASPRLLINSRADVAVAVGADGVHLTSAQEELTPAQVRSLYESAGLPEPIVSISCHTIPEVERARASAASLILFGPVFEKVAGGLPQQNARVSEGIGLQLLRTACAAAARVPVLALGGVTSGNTAACLEAGAAGIAAIRLFAQ